MSSGADVQQIYTDNPGALPASYSIVQDLSVQSIVARIDGSGAAGSFLPTLSLYGVGGNLIARVPSDVTYAVGDTGVVTWSPFLARRVAATPATATKPEWSAPTFLGLFEQASSGYLTEASGAGRFVLVADAASIYGGYVQATADAKWFDVMIDLGPQYSSWMVSVLAQTGSDFGRLQISLGNDAYNAVIDPSIGDFDLKDYSTVTYVNLGTVIDCYTAAAGAFQSTDSTRGPFTIMGVAGDLGTTFTGVNKLFNGGPGPMRLRVTVSGKNAASTGFRARVMGVVVKRVSEDAL